MSVSAIQQYPCIRRLKAYVKEPAASWTSKTVRVALAFFLAFPALIIDLILYLPIKILPAKKSVAKLHDSEKWMTTADGFRMPCEATKPSRMPREDSKYRAPSQEGPFNSALRTSSNFFRFNRPAPKPPTPSPIERDRAYILQSLESALEIFGKNKWDKFITCIKRDVPVPLFFSIKRQCIIRLILLHYLHSIHKNPDPPPLPELFNTNDLQTQKNIEEIADEIDRINEAQFSLIWTWNPYDHFCFETLSTGEVSPGELKNLNFQIEAVSKTLSINLPNDPIDEFVRRLFPEDYL